MKLCATFLLVLVTLPLVTGEKSSERSLSGAILRGVRRTCSRRGHRCIRDSQCCGGMCCQGNRCFVAIRRCFHLPF
uniref:Conotoxin ar11a n=1 Tax=Conus arenatus TaxID=89451 RepID=I1BA_CONAE|nr:RecName: Full=Conotoxin ar11a; AltName: Full=Ar11.1; Flags: Precursor [Conus arenatus]